MALVGGKIQIRTIYHLLSLLLRYRSLLFQTLDILAQLSLYFFRKFVEFLVSLLM